MLDIVFILLGLILLLNFVKTLVKNKSPLRKAFFSMLTGIGALLAANLTAFFIQTQVSINIYTAFISLVLGVPGVLLIIVKNIFI